MCVVLSSPGCCLPEIGQGYDEVYQFMGMPCSWDGKVSWLSGYQGIPQSHSRCSSLQFCFRERFPSASVTTPLLQGWVSPAKLLELCQGRRRVTALLRSPLPLECNKSAPLGNSFPGKAVRFCSGSGESCYSWVHPGWNVIPAQQTSLKRFTRKKETRRVGASRVRSNNRLNRVQSLYKVSWGAGWSFPEWLGIGRIL